MAAGGASDSYRERIPMRVTMTKTMPGSEDGIRVQSYATGETYEMGEALAQAFIGSHCARPVAEDMPPAPSTTKQRKGPSENK